MATLVFSAIGTALGGPIGSAIGALVGQSIDQQLLAPARRGPRVGDLAVQTSSYGTPIPRIYGTMRVAGSVIWSTDLLESAATGGAKGQPDVTFSYGVSLAVALSSRPVKSIKRIWADGKLLRGVGGDFKVGTTFRFYAGGEDQSVDPLIASSEGIARTPAYRGIAFCVFENLELAEFGNRIPFFTFEVEGDDEAPSLGSVVSDASDGVMAIDADRLLEGYAAYGSSVKESVGPLIEAFDVALFDDGSHLRSPVLAPPPTFLAEDFGNSADAKTVALFERERAATRSLPAALRLTHYDPARDYQTGEARSTIGEPGIELQQQLPAVFSADDAKGLANEIIARAWAARDRLTLRLPTSAITCQPGTILALPFVPTHWQVQSVTIEAFVTIVELRPVAAPSVALIGDGGRVANNPDFASGPVTLALLDIPDPSRVSTEPTLLLSASSPGETWKAQTAELTFGGFHQATRTARAKATLGRTVGTLAVGTPHLLDEKTSIEILLIDHDQWLESRDLDALIGGANAAVVGSELIQFGRAEPLGDGRWRLSRLLRGRAGTDWACDAHEPDEIFCLLEADSLQRVTLPLGCLGGRVTAMVGNAQTTVPLDGEALRPLTPVQLSAQIDGDGDMVVCWTRRSRAGLAWVDGVDVPLGETREVYRVIVASSTQSIELSTGDPSMHIDGATLVELGAGPISITVQQIGDFAASRPAQITLN